MARRCVPMLLYLHFKPNNWKVSWLCEICHGCNMAAIKITTIEKTRCWQPFGVCGEGLYPPVHTSIIIMAGMAVFYVAGLIEERCRWPVITASPRGQCSK